ncbi:platelet glycoprotein Ib alpha chain [Xiphias gladius]|uniref:platelet glycoprotein Ib alpha chain n=1 Tax=Xiphias gladius TaxID=8245 RepID=UPI001A984827|nr:platelet glycoprotein Ib alpha chain [Xiphias gladius]
MQLFLLLLLFLLSHLAMVTAVAGCQSDSDKDHRPRENCTEAGFDGIPAGFAPATKVLLFPRNLFTSLPWSSFQILTEIYEIDLTGNKVPEVTPSVTSILPTLSVLRLGSNILTSLSDDSFSACPALTELYLENNNINSLSDHTFSGLSKLEILDLSYNHIKVLPELMLHPLPAIETLYLESNKIKVMPDEWFGTKEEVPYLYLSANPWACSCSLDYLRTYLENYEINVYVRDGPLIKNDVESVVCDSPWLLKGKPVMSLGESDLCPPAKEPGPDGDFDQPPITESPSTTAATSIPTIANIPPTTPPPTTPPATTPPPTTPPATTPPPTTTPPTIAITAAATVAPSVVTLQLHTEVQSVFTWSWSQTMTRFIEGSGHPGAKRSSVPTRTSVTHPSFPAVRPTLESLANMTTAAPTKPGTTESVPSTVTTPKLQEVTTPATAEVTPVPIPSWVINGAVSGQQHGKSGAVGAAGVFCFWLFAACVLLCVASLACILATLARLVVWYRRVYKPLSVALARRGGGSEAMRMLTYSKREEKEVAGGGGVMALYRSVLFIHREGGERMEREGEGAGEGGKERLLVTLEPTGTGEVKREAEGERGGREERGVYRKTLYRLLSKEEEIEGWRDVMEECRVSAEDVGGKGGGGGVSRKRYSVILREERGEAGQGREELDWVVGGWEVKRGGGEEVGRGEEPRSSWGEWLAHYLPSMPWGVTMPPEGEAAQ